MRLLCTPYRGLLDPRRAPDDRTVLAAGRTPGVETFCTKAPKADDDEPIEPHKGRLSSLQFDASAKM